jgi:hypothetical protein
MQPTLQAAACSVALRMQPAVQAEGCHWSIKPLLPVKQPAATGQSNRVVAAASLHMWHEGDAQLVTNLQQRNTAAKLAQEVRETESAQAATRAPLIPQLLLLLCHAASADTATAGAIATGAVIRSADTTCKPLAHTNS